jgi:hypothetical protein
MKFISSLKEQIVALGLGGEIDVLEKLAIEILSSQNRNFQAELPGVQEGVIRSIAIKASILKTEKGVPTIAEIFEEIKNVF